MALTIERIAAVTGAPPKNVAQMWPLLLSSLTEHDMPLPSTQIACVATVAVEAPSFLPQSEKYNGIPEVYFTRYDGRADLGNTEPGDGLRFKGRGFIQITGRANYQRYGDMLGIDLVGNPELALEPKVSADILALFFRDRHIDAQAKAGNWKTVRKLVNGGYNNLEEFLGYVNALEKSA